MTLHMSRQLDKTSIILGTFERGEPTKECIDRHTNSGRELLEIGEMDVCGVELNETVLKTLKEVDELKHKTLRTVTLTNASIATRETGVFEVLSEMKRLRALRVSSTCVM